MTAYWYRAQRDPKKNKSKKRLDGVRVDLAKKMDAYKAYVKS